MQAALIDAAAKEQEGYRSYLLSRLVPAMHSHYEEEFLAVDEVEAADSLTSDGVTQRLAALTTRQLERRLAHFYQGLLNVRILHVLQASILKVRQLFANAVAELNDGCLWVSAWLCLVGACAWV